MKLVKKKVKNVPISNFRLLLERRTYIIALNILIFFIMSQDRVQCTFAMFPAEAIDNLPFASRLAAA